MNTGTMMPSIPAAASAATDGGVVAPAVAPPAPAAAAAAAEAVAIMDVAPDSDDETTPEDEAALQAKAKTKAAAEAAAKANAEAAAAARAKARRRAAAAKRRKQWETVPTTSYEFLRVWKALGKESGGAGASGDADDAGRAGETSADGAAASGSPAQRRAAYMRLIGAKAFGKLFKSAGIESNLFVELVAVARDAFLPRKPGHLLALLDGLAKCSRFSTTLMFLSDAEKAALGPQIKGMLAAHGENFPKRAGRIQAKYASLLG